MKMRKRINGIILFAGTIVVSSIFVTGYYRHNTAKREIVQAAVVEGNVKQDTNNSAKSNISLTEFINKELTLDKNAYDAGTIQDFLSKNIKINDGKKIVFLTFDDGPSTTVTPKVLEVLKKNDIRATFFIVGKELEKNSRAKQILLDTYKQGNSIGNHTYTHIYNNLYPGGKVDVDKFMAELDKNNDAIRKVLGQDFKSRIVRFPGGHMSWKGVDEADKRFNDIGYKYIDWNGIVGDAEGKPKSKEQLLNTYRQTFKNQQKLVLLMHDTYGKENTAEVLPDIIADLKNKGYEFKILE
ncbi:polysaccharide deacetylase [Clostridium folliculivorans]|uniref:Polysaccharide deacetylase n=2 Tax=Clostridium folliculivorans TaxID=2886038 RepID=A0A9W6D761_9CLOT|nr:polysaccharide deacetylase family protein [Clostridium folliculivorans]GKU23175.1 polysaccharide deacetylase [Clostridium folliculivorans]GKU29221.1 polysaccharide deacetylase [Clostridium folliculivorans]